MSEESTHSQLESQNESISSKEKDELARVKPQNEEHGAVVANHYNNIEEKGLDERFNSPIFYMRNFNNWVKTVLINKFIDKLKERDYRLALRVLDICCGKGGDLMKWQKCRIKHLVCADIASVSVEQCRARHDDFSRRDRSIFTAEFIVADCTKKRLREKYSDPSISFDLVSCQFGFHYCFESLPQAECMLQNISECLRPGGYFIGTIPDAYEIVSRCKRNSSLSFSNRVLKLKLLFNPEEGYPLFGAKYDFSLEGVVDCPEFLVHFPLLIKLAARYGLELVFKDKFDKFFNENREQYSHLFGRMKVFESYPASKGEQLLGPAAEYTHAETYLGQPGKTDTPVIGTMSQAEWEAASVYMVFAFKKCKGTLDADGKPVFKVDSKPDAGSSRENTAVSGTPT